MNELVEIKENENIKDLIREIRGVQVIIDRDLAKLYEVETRAINQAVKRNIERFPEEFCFRLTNKEFEDWKSQIVISNNEKMSLRKAPYAFTEQGVAMLSGMLKSEKAIKTSIQVINAFVIMRRYLSGVSIEQKYINELVLKDNKRIDIIENVLSNFKEQNNHIYFSGQFYDAHSLMIDILNKSKKEIIIIDNYLDKNLLDILKDTNKKIKIVTNKYKNTDYNKYKKQYNNITLQIENDIHDRFIIIDKKTLYHCGASFKDLGNKCFAINKIDNDALLNDLITKYTL